MIQNDLESALALWDSLDDNAEIFVPIIPNEESKKNLFFIERDKANKNLILRVFITREEGDIYRTNKKVSKMVLAATTFGHLMESLEKNLKMDIDRRIDCVLSTMDMEGTFRTIEILWSNTNKSS